MTQYKHIFFDLDRTLWDLETNSQETLLEIYNDMNIEQMGTIDFNSFFITYNQINDRLWEQYRKGLIEKNKLRYHRFEILLHYYNIDYNVLAKKMGDAYISSAPKKTSLIPNTFSVLEYLKLKYKIHIITNGFEEVQHLKLETSGIKSFFSEIITSENASCKKPDPRIFAFALHQTGAKRTDSIMIGDSLELDILGAKSVGIDQVYFNPKKIKHKHKITYEIDDLSQLFQIL